MTDFIPPKPEPHPRKLSLLGRLGKLRKSSLAVVYDRSYSMHLGDVWTPLRMVYFANQPDLVERVLVSEAARFPKSNVTGSMLSLLLGDGVFVSNGELWQKQRRMIDPSFEQARIKDVFPLMRDAVDSMIRRLRDIDDGTILAADEETTHVTADIIFRTIFSRSLTREESSRIFRAFNQFQEISYSQGVWSMAGVPDFLHFGRLFAARSARTIRGLLEFAVHERLEELAAGTAPKRKDILASLLEAVDPVTGAKFSRRELVDQIAVMFLAGHETSASALAWALYLMAMCPQVQERMHAEALACFGARAPEYADMKRLRLNRDVFRETLRLYPPVSFISRDTTREERLRDKVIKKGSVIFVSPWLIHRHTKLWERPDAFDPDRFADPGTRESVRSAYLPFSTGPRVCPGASFAMQEAVLILACLAREFRFEPAPGHTPKPVSRLTLRSENGIRLRMFRRPPVDHAARAEAADRVEAPAQCPYH